MGLTIYPDRAHEDSLIQQASLSDLFFNYEHPERDALYRSRGTPTQSVRDVISEEDERAALLKDAMSFAAVLKNGTGMLLEPAELVDDYLSRE